MNFDHLKPRKAPPDKIARGDDRNIYAWYGHFQNLAKTAEKLHMPAMEVKLAVKRYTDANGIFLVTSNDWNIQTVAHPINPKMARTEDEIAKLYYQEKSLIGLHNITGYPITDLKKILENWGRKPGHFLVRSPDWDSRTKEPMRWDRFIETVKTKNLDQCKKILGLTDQEIETNIYRLQMSGVQIEMPVKPKTVAGKGELVPVAKKERKFNPGTAAMHTQGKNSTFSGRMRKAKSSKKTKGREKHERLKLGRGIQGKKPIAAS